MALIDEITKKIRDGKESFVLTNSTATFRFMSCQAGLARIYYATRTYGKEIEVEDNAEPCAIVKGKDICLLDGYLYWLVGGGSDNVVLPRGVTILSDEVQRVNDTYAQEEFEKYLAELPVNLPDDECSIDKAQEAARWHLFTGKELPKPEIGEPVLTGKHVIASLCTNSDLRATARKLLESRRKIFEMQKSWAEFVQTMTQSVGLVEPWEQRLADALRSVDAQNVTLEFNYKEVTAEEKFSAETLMRLLVKRDDFSSFSFPTMKGGEKLFKLLGIPSGARYADRLFCSHITRMSFRGKTLYQKEESK